MPRRRDPGKAVLMLDLLTEFFDNGQRWLQEDYHDDNGNRCLISAITHLRAVNGIAGDGTSYYLREAQPQWIYKRITEFNDDCRSMRTSGRARLPKPNSTPRTLRRRSGSRRNRPLLMLRQNSRILESAGRSRPKAIVRRSRDIGRL
ncbi:MAG: hypothetical protein JO266_21090 [Acidobacteria bacterium]|nr:hypothetical protein [Acidobacteriota bacterium]